LRYFVFLTKKHNQLSEDTLAIYKYKVRTRVNALLVRDKSVLLLGHSGLLDGDRLFWSGPGGGVELEEHCLQALHREVLEEVNVQVSEATFFGVYQFISGGFHAVELFFVVDLPKDSTPYLGQDPEMDISILKQMTWWSYPEVLAANPVQMHQAVIDFCKKQPK
jgi:8-oxo-dGTP diphosphatase